ncbi:PREDICTED: adenomatous polyposis coli protein 2-like, partial [Tinamus guttatus]|uniref:adenomatous polyposis coli protein 2-like n=1 Tax=Tinamus guttatus TaxID=94827 RepID=UPI00052EFCB9
MSGSIASYEQLVRQVEALKKENSHLRRELQDNSHHLSKLENETSDMKEVLKHLQGKLEQEARVMVSSGQTEVLEQLRAHQMDISSLYNLKFPAAALVPELAEEMPLPAPRGKDGAGDPSRATLRILEELDRERCFLLGEMEKEEKEKGWYYTQLQSLSKRLDELPHVETFSMQMDLIRQQLEFEAQHIRALMEERFGTADEMVQRAQIRASRLEQIDKELMEAQDKVQQTEPPLPYKSQSNPLAIIESGGGILRNVSSLVATREDYRQVLRDHNCLQTLLQHLRSHSLTIVSNACGTLWNLSARSPKDQELLWDLGAVSMLRNLIHSKHKMIAMGSAAALRNLLTNRPPKYKDAAVISPGSCMPSLYMRKQKALEAELDAKHLAETFDTMEKQSLKSQSAKKPLRHMESLVKDYASDSGCFDDDEVPNVSSGVETANASVLSMFLNSSFLQGQALPRALAQRRCPEPEKDSKTAEPRKPPLPEDDVSLAAEKLANKISSTVAKIDKLVEDISTMHTSSDDSFSLSSEDHGL